MKVTSIKIITLIENLVYGGGLVAEHGLSFYIEDGNKKIIFDTGQSGRFIQNAQKLGIAIDEIDALVLSHGHYDHTGGLYPFLEINSKAMVYAKNGIFDRKYHGETRFIGTDFREGPLKNRLICPEISLKVSDHVHIMTDIPIQHPQDTHFDEFNIEVNRQKFPDDFRDELYLAIIREERVNIVTSCSHRGITNICDNASGHFNFPVNLVLGGFHTRNSTPEQMTHILNYFKKLKPQSIGVCHCTGSEMYTLLSQSPDIRVFYNFTGREIIV